MPLAPFTLPRGTLRTDHTRQTIPYSVVQAFERLHGWSTDATAFANALEQRLATLPPILSLDQIRDALEVGGSSTLNVTNLLGAGGGVSPGIGEVRYGTHDERLAMPPTSEMVTTRTIFLETDRGAIYAATQPGLWVLILGLVSGLSGDRPADLVPADAGFLYIEEDRAEIAYRWTGFAWQLLPGWGGPVIGTLNPDTKPAGLGIADSELRFWAFDFNRLYRWSGLAWADAPAQPQRGMIVGFEGTDLPGTGWALCDGSIVSQSTSTGGIIARTTPDLVAAANQIIQYDQTSGASGLSVVVAGGTEPLYNLIPFLRL